MTVLSVSEAAQAVGLTTYTLRWYEQEGLVHPVARDSAGRRQYSENDLGFLTLLTKLRRTGMSVADMRRYAELIRGGPSTVTARKELLLAHRQRVLDQIAELQRDLEAVNYKIDRYFECEKEQP
ncbi:MerR family transcriptional regulator [Rhizocola hellebori]|uniref:MerR family transcriptional regulator n=1 Tax=Rhizocola hellebori TaxID=1392758 RepID=A0A8J3VGM2_9ACTN|nr:MerR family transcriptional regulator [Rhizocola hellebori]GIH06519.1 MerR family transcriptional regulator [Rhizocola hellebori]